MASSRELKARHFERYVANLASCAKHLDGFPTLGRVFVCPICLRGFDESVLEVPDVLTLEHVIPQCLGGRDGTTTLLCKDCNNASGSVYDAALVGELRAQDIMKQRSAGPVDIQFSVDGHTVNASIVLPLSKGDHLQIIFDDKRSNPRHTAGVHQSLTPEQWGPDTSFEISYSLRYSQRRARIAALRIGYLMLFRMLGYSYATHQNLKVVREQLWKPDEEIIPEGYSINIPEPPHANRIGVVFGPPPIKGFFAVIRLTTPHSVWHKLVILPGLDPDPTAVMYSRTSPPTRPRVTGLP